MTLTPPKFHIADDMPMSLGKAIARAIAPQPDRIEAFNKGQHSHIAFNSATKTCLLTPISEKDCRQIKGAAPESKSAYAGTLSRPASTDAAPPSVQKFKPGDRVKTSEDSDDSVFVLLGLRTDVRELFLGQWNAQIEGGEQLGILDPELMELIPSPASETEGEGWVTWGGGEMPPYARVEVKFEDGIHFKDTLPRSLDLRCWTYKDVPKGNKILAYRVVKP